MIGWGSGSDSFYVVKAGGGVLVKKGPCLTSMRRHTSDSLYGQVKFNLF